MFTPASIVYAWDNQLGYALALLDDLTDEQFVLRPGGKMNHPAWIVGHIAAYHPVIGQLLRGELVVDPKDDPLFAARCTTHFQPPRSRHPASAAALGC